MYSIKGVFARGSRHLGFSSVKGAKRVSNESARMTACKDSSRCSVWTFGFLPFEGLGFLGGMIMCGSRKGYGTLSHSVVLNQAPGSRAQDEARLRRG